MEALAFRQLEDDAREVARKLALAEHASAPCGIQDFETLPFQSGAHPRQHDEMVEVPVEDRGERELVEIVDFAPQRAAVEADLLAYADQRLERDPLERNAEPPAQRREVGPKAMMPRNHCQTRQSAFARFGLADQRRGGAPGEVESGFHAEDPSSRWGPQRDNTEAGLGISRSVDD